MSLTAYDVVEHLDIHHLRARNNLARDHDVLGARLGVARGVVMNDDKRRVVLSYGWAQRLSQPDDGRVDVANVHTMDTEHFVLGGVVMSAISLSTDPWPCSG